MRCEIRDSKFKLIAMGHSKGSLYYLYHNNHIHQAYVDSDCKRSKETMWHCRFGHLGAQGMQELAKSKMVKGLDLERREDFSFCALYVQGKNHHLPFQQSSMKRTDHLLKLIHSDVCGKIGTRSLDGGEYFVSFLDNHIQHVNTRTHKNDSHLV